MANPTKRQAWSTQLNAVEAFISFAVGATGAVGAVQQGQEFRPTTPVVRVSAGVYDLFLAEAWAGLLPGEVINVRGTIAATDGIIGRVTTDNVATVAAPKVRITLTDDETAAAEVASGNSVHVRLVLQQ